MKARPPRTPEQIAADRANLITCCNRVEEALVRAAKAHVPGADLAHGMVVRTLKQVGAKEGRP